MLGLKGVITVQGDRNMAYECDRKSLELVDELPTRKTNPPTMQVKHSRPKMAPMTFDQTKKVPLDKDASPKSTKMLSGLGNAKAPTQKVLVMVELHLK